MSEATFTFHEAANAGMTYTPGYHEAYSGQGDGTLVNLLRGTKNFHDGQWLGWLNTDVEMELDLHESREIKAVGVGFLESQGAGIYYPTDLTVSVSKDGQTYREVGTFHRDPADNPDATIADFGVNFPAQDAHYLRVAVKHGRSWLFVDEVTVR